LAVTAGDGVPPRTCPCVLVLVFRLPDTSDSHY
jgi:hypothetical protein